MRYLVAALAACLATPVAAADVSALVRDKGLTAAAAELSASTDANDRFALAGVLFLGTIEEAWQTRWRHNLSAGMPVLPGAQAALPENPAAEPATADIVNRLALDLLDGMDKAAAVLETIPGDADPSFSVNVADLWFDVNASGARDPGEDFAALAMPVIISPWEAAELAEALEANPGAPSPMTATIRFDAADADWLLAYTHFLRGAAEAVLAFDPAPEVARTLDLRKALAAQMAEVGARPAQFDEMGHWSDIVAIVINTLGHQPDAARIAKARAHLLDMVRLSRSFWQKVALETDNEAEWIPNPAQTAALGFALPADSGPAWLAVLDDAERLLKGERLIPFWRFGGTEGGTGYGVNFGRWLDAPEPVPVIDWIQGTAALPYVEKGTLLTAESWQRFSATVAGRGLLFAVLLN